MKGIITEIRTYKAGARVTVGDGEHLLLTRRDLRTFALREGDAVDAQELAQELLQAQYPHALNRAVRLLAVRARSVYEVEKRLTDAFYQPDTVEMVLTKLTINKLLDDEAFARQWAQARLKSQIGKTRILHELRQKGVDDATAQQAVADLDPDRQDDSAEKLARKLWGRYANQDASAARRKTLQAMQRRGFSYGDAKRALDAVTEEDGGEEDYDL